MSSREFKGILEQVNAGKTAHIQRVVDGTTYLRKWIPEERLILLGGGHIAQPLCKIAALLDFSVTVVDDRPTFANKTRFPEAATVICDNFPAGIDQLSLRPTDYVCVITRGHRYDGDCLRQILAGVLPSYLGMIGSKRRVKGLLGLLEEEGFETGKLEQIHAPIGLPIHALTPAEIAVSITAQLVAHRRKDTPSRVEVGMPLSQTNTDMHLLEFLAQDTNPKALMLVLESKGSTPVKPGAVMAIDSFGGAYGTIGGGCSENAVMQTARRIIGSGRSVVTEVDMTNEMAAEEGMVCGGTMQVLIEDIPVE